MEKSLHTESSLYLYKVLSYKLGNKRGMVDLSGRSAFTSTRPWGNASYFDLAWPAGDILIIAFATYSASPNTPDIVL